MPDAPCPSTTLIGEESSGASVELRDSLLFQPFARNLDFEARDADRAPDSLAPFARDVLMVLRHVEKHGEGAAFEAFHRAAHEKKS